VVHLEGSLLREYTAVNLVRELVLNVHVNIGLRADHTLTLVLLLLLDLLLDLRNLLGGFGDLVGADNEDTDSEAAEENKDHHDKDYDQTAFAYFL